MSGTIEGAKKAVQTNKRKYGRDFYVRIGAMGGKRSHGGGFAKDGRSLIDKLLGKPKRAAIAGHIGGKLSKRGKSVNL